MLTVVLLYIALCALLHIHVYGESGITNYECADKSVCDDQCQKLAAYFESEGKATGWGIRHPSLSRHYSQVQCKVCVEIGVARGELAHYLIRHNPHIEEYHGIDPFLGNYDKSDAMSNELAKWNTSTAWAATVQNALKSFGCKFRLHYGLSTARAPDFPKNSIDCIFIDGDHTFEGVKTDIMTFSPILKPGGYYFFDDVSYQFPGTTKAVETFVEKNSLEIVQVNKHNNYRVRKPTDENQALDFNW